MKYIEFYLISNISLKFNNYVLSVIERITIRGTVTFV